MRVLDSPTPEGWKAELTWITRQCNGQEPNLRPVDHKSDALTTTLPSHSIVDCLLENTDKHYRTRKLAERKRVQMLNI